MKPSAFHSGSQQHWLMELVSSYTRRMQKAIVCLLFVVAMEPSLQAQFFLDVAQVEGDQIDQFDQLAFAGQPIAAIRKKLASQADLEIKQIHQSCTLNAAQVEKLQFAANGDICRFFREVDDAKSQLKIKGTADPQKQAEIRQKVSLSASQFSQKLSRGVFGKGSLFKKVVEQTLEPAQQNMIDEQNKMRTKRTLKSYAKIRLAKIEEQIPLMASQRNAILEQISAIIEEKEIPLTHANNVADIVLIGILNKKGLNEILDEKQIDILRKVVSTFESSRQQLAIQGIKLE